MEKEVIPNIYWPSGDSKGILTTNLSIAERVSQYYKK